MNSNTIIVSSPTDIRAIISEVLEEKMQVFSKWFEAKLVDEDKPLNPNEAMEYLGVVKSTFYRYVKEGLIPQYGNKGKRYYKKSELDNFLYKKRLN